MVKRKKRKSPSKKIKKKKPTSRILLKTSIDILVGGLISIGVYQSPTFLLETLYSYLGLLSLLIMIIILMLVYSLRFGKEDISITIFMMIIISFLEVYLIGVLLSQSFEMIMIVWFITLPSIIIFDKLMG